MLSDGTDEAGHHKNTGRCIMTALFTPLKCKQWQYLSASSNIGHTFFKLDHKLPLQHWSKRDGPAEKEKTTPTILWIESLSGMLLLHVARSTPAIDLQLRSQKGKDLNKGVCNLWGKACWEKTSTPSTSWFSYDEEQVSPRDRHNSRISNAAGWCDSISIQVDS